MLGKPYLVKERDTLWDIASRELGDPFRWPELYEYNNTNTVVAATGMRIRDPDLIFVGQKIYIPDQSIRQGSSMVKPHVPTAKPPPSKGRKVAAKKVKSIAFKYNLSDLPTITVTSPAYIAKVSLKGSVTLQSLNTVDFATITKEGFELTAKREADLAFGKLVTGAKVGFNAATKEITFECGITSYSDSPYILRTSATAGISSKTGMPVMKAAITAKDLKGKVVDYLFLASGWGVEIEVTPRPPSAKPRPIPVPSARPAPSPGRGWDQLLGAALVVGAGVLVVATIVEDIATLGVGVADDAPSFATAAAMFSGGVVMYKSVSGGAPITIEGHGVAQNQL